MKSGFISIIGRPNVGKSTLLNRIVGKKVAIMSNKPQTTRNLISGVLTKENEYQLIFIDTPGIHKPHNELGKRMTEQAYSQTKGVDAIIWMISVGDRLTTGEQMIIDNLKNTKTPIYLVINKIDDIKSRSEVDKTILEFADKLNFKGVFPISALEGTKVDELINELVELVPEGPQYYPTDMITDHPEKFLIGEIIREKVLKYTQEEIPHSVAVVIESLKKDEKDESIMECFAAIYVERDSQKGILIGKGGEMLKRIGHDARIEIKEILGTKVYLDIWVKVKPDWRNSSVALKALGYDIDNF